MNRPFFLFFACLLVAACGGSDATISNVPPAADLTGSWNGNWLSRTGQGGSTTSTLTQSGTAITGTIAFTSSVCFSSGKFSGTISGDDFVATVTAGDIRIDLNGTATNDTYSGTYRATQAGACTGDTGTFSANR